jgi:hypothetical protein
LFDSARKVLQVRLIYKVNDKLISTLVNEIFWLNVAIEPHIHIENANLLIIAFKSLPPVYERNQPSKAHQDDPNHDFLPAKPITPKTISKGFIMRQNFL